METDRQNNIKIAERLLLEVQQKIINSKYIQLLHEGNPPQVVPKKRLKSPEEQSINRSMKRLSVLKREEYHLRQRLRSVLQTQKLAIKSRQKNVQILSHAVSDELLREYILKYRKFKKEVLQREITYHEEEQIYKQKIKQLQEKKQTQQCSKRRKKIEKKLQKMNKRREDKKLQIQAQKQILKKLKKSKKLHERMTEKYQTDKLREVEENNFSFHLRRQADYINLSGLTNHSQLYDSQLKEREQLRSSKLKENSRILPQISPQKSIFYSRIIKYEEEDKENLEKQKQRKKMTRVLQKEYGERVEKEFKPKKMKNQSITEHKTLKKSSIPREKIKQMGNKYFEAVKYLMNRHPKPKKKEEKKVYPNYLPEFTRNRTLKKQNPYQKVKNQVRQLMENENLSPSQRIRQFKIRTEQYNQPLKHEGDDEFLKVLSTKIELLKMIE